MKASVHESKTLPILPALVVMTSFVANVLLFATIGYIRDRGACLGGDVFSLSWFILIAFFTGFWGTPHATFVYFGLGWAAYRISITVPPGKRLPTLFLWAVVIFLIHMALTIVLDTLEGDISAYNSYIQDGTRLYHLLFWLVTTSAKQFLDFLEDDLLFWLVTTLCAAFWMTLFQKSTSFAADAQPQHLTIGRVASVVTAVILAYLPLWVAKSWTDATAATMQEYTWVVDTSVFYTLPVALLLRGPVLSVLLCFLSVVASGLVIAVLYPPAHRTEVVWALIWGVGYIALPLFTSVVMAFLRKAWPIEARIIGAGIIVTWLMVIWIGTAVHRLRWGRL